MKLSNIEIHENVSISVTLATSIGSVDVFEWINENQKVERTDSNITMNIDLTPVFDMSEKPSLMSDNDWLPISEVYDALDIAIAENL